MSTQSARGFTLLEIMIAVGITALMGSLVAVTFQTGLTAKDSVEAEADRYRALRVAMSRMTREIGAAFVSDRYDPKRFRDANDRPTNFIGSKDRLLFTSMAHQRLYADAKESDQMVVEYVVKTSTERNAHGRQDLIRRENPIIGEPMDRGGTEEPLLEDVRKIEFAYWDSEKKEWDDDWDTRRIERKQILPTRVKVTLYAKDENGKEARYVTQTRVMLNTELPRN